MATAGALHLPAANVRGRAHFVPRNAPFRSIKDGGSTCPRSRPAVPCLPGTKELHLEESRFKDLAEFGLEGTGRVGPPGQPVINEMDLRVRLRKQGHCYGCGVRLQISKVAAAGYVDPDKFNLKRMHRQTDKILCMRCTDLCNGKMVPAVEDFRQRERGPFGAPVEALTLNGKTLISPEDFRAQLMEVGSKKALVLMLVDLLDVSGTMMNKVRDLVGRNPIILVGTKLDLLPAGCHPKAVVAWLLDAAMRKRLSVVSAHLVSSHTMEGLSAVASKACAERKGRDVYVIGAANVGKSAFVRALLRELRSFESRNFDAAALSSGKYLPVESAMPGTTLGLIPLQAFASGGMLYDTPGVHLHHRIPHMLSPNELKLLHPRRRLCVYRPPSPLDIMAEHEEQPEDGSKRTSVSATYQWSDLVRVDVVEGPPSLTLVFNGPHSMKVVHGPFSNEPPRHDILAQDTAPAKAPCGRAVLSCTASVALRGGLVPHTLQMASTGGGMQAVADIAVSGLPGWVTLWVSHSRENIRLRVWAVRGVEVFLRPPFPTQLPEQLLDDEASMPANRSFHPNLAGSDSSRRAVPDNTTARVHQIFRRFQVEEIKEQDSGPDASQLLAMLKKEVAELEEIGTVHSSQDSDPESKIDVLQSPEPDMLGSPELGISVSPPVQGTSVHRSTRPRPHSGLGPSRASELALQGRAAAAHHRQGVQQSQVGRQNAQDLSALFGAAMEDVAGPLQELAAVGKNAMPDTSAAGGTSTSSSIGTSSKSSFTRSSSASPSISKSRQGGDITTHENGQGHQQARAGQGNLDLSSLFGTALEDSIPGGMLPSSSCSAASPGTILRTATASSRPEAGPLSMSLAEWGFADAGTPQGIQGERGMGQGGPLLGATASKQASKNRSRARQMADDEAKERGAYDRPRLFPDSERVPEPTARAGRVGAGAGGLVGLSISELAAKYAALSCSGVQGGGDASESEGGAAGADAGGRRQGVDTGEKQAGGVTEETFVLDEDLINEIAVQANKKNGGRKRR